MERAIGQSVMSVRSERAFESSSFVFSRIETPEQTVRIYCVGKLGLDERLVRLPDLVLEENCKVVKLEKKIRVFRLPLRIGRAIKFVYVKQHNALSFWHRLTSTTEKLSFIKAYIGDEISDRRYARHLIRSILKETSRQIMKARWRLLIAEKHQPSLEARSALDELGKNECCCSTLG